ncbi:type I-B CRISPR-associated protein Cas7/Csh2 [Methanosphaera sp. WGK6]|uniref:type I-B CRISPR-associated protein Cas7/Csh2 n=1 Tax=Methanosphaera sp. WGK6 TaxID=1561964 RepID=UPI00084BE662|nr:type I-B CRISPR-associated protein Cas7/Csh2 [Methanosphaera sp. WGK6]OED29881.1 CRISPR-associated protein Csh2 [Methanosphaera sp. WGK6]
MNRSELLFIYDINDANPNGDPLDENKPRIDEDTEKNIVTDVRLKRTIRDYLEEYADESIFVKEKVSESGEGIQDAKARAKDFLPEGDYESLDDAKKIMKENILSECIDARLFGGTIPIEVKIKKKNQSGSITLTGPVQFRMGRSLNRVNIEHIKGTGAFASGDSKSQKTFREEYVVHYSLVTFYGAINENAAKYTHMGEEDINKLLDGMWNGTKNLITRSKFGQTPRLLLQIEYSENNFFIGDLNNKLSIKHDFDSDKEIRSINEFTLVYDQLLNSFEKYSDKISKIYYKLDDSLKTEDNSNKSLIENINSLGIETEELLL